MDFLYSLFHAAGFTSRWEDPGWTPSLIWMQFAAEAAIWAAFTTTLVALNYFILRRRDRPVPRAFWVFEAFLLANSTLHLVQAVLLWWPIYRFEAVLRLLTAVLSWAAVVSLIPVIPRVLALRRPEELEREIAERKRAEETLHVSEQRFRTMAETMPAMVAIFQGTGHAYVNRAAETLVGYSRDELLHRSFLDYVHPDFRALVKERSLARQRGEDVPSRYEIKIVHKSGRTLWIDFAAAVIEYEGKPAVLGIAIDVTQRKEMEEALRSAMEAAEAASRAKGTFLANMSHEIRTPMNAVLGMTELVLDTPLTKDQRQYLETVHDSGESLLAIINDVLDFSKIEAGKLDLECTPFDLLENVEDMMKSLAVRAHTQGIELACRFDPGVPADVVGDRTRLRQILTNLVGNAIKFTPRGEVVVDVRSTPVADGQVEIHFIVSDTGIGIPTDKLGSIFQAFEQADTSMTRRHGGTGLGLAITCRLVDLMHGKIWVESRVGQGSEFHFTAQFALPEPGALPIHRIEPVQVYGTKALIVDDNATNRRILEEILRNWGMRPASACGAAEALAALREASRLGEPFPLVLSDVNMPDVDGFELVSRCRRDDDLRGSIFVMLTSGSRPGDVARCEELGVTAHLIKPVKQSELYDAITEAIGVAAPTHDDAKQGAGMVRTRPLRILVVEDSLPNQKLAVGLLSKWGHAVTVASNGREAVEMAQSSAPFDLILMDVQMPEMDGFEATARIRDLEKSAGRPHVPVVAMTAHALKGDRERCLDAGMDGYVSKPIRAAELARVIAEVVGTDDGDPARVFNAPENARNASPALAACVDWPAALAAVQDDHDLLRSVIAAALDEWPELLEQLRSALAGNDAATAQRIAHTFRGGLSTLGATAAQNAALQIESAARIGERGVCESLLPAFVPQLETILDELAAKSAEASPAETQRPQR